MYPIRVSIILSASLNSRGFPSYAAHPDIDACIIKGTKIAEMKI
jgi:hypothetical protein